MDEYLDFAKGLAGDAGKIMLEHFRVGVPNQLKENNTPVTIADTTINQMVIDTVKARYPDHAVLGEEKSHNVADAPYIWVCDPLDGTMPFSIGVPTFVFSLALVDTKDGQPKVAVVYDPSTDRLYSAVAGGRAFLNGDPIQVNKVGRVEDAFIGTSSKRSTVIDTTELRRAIVAACYRQLCYQATIYEGMLVASGQLGGQLFVGSGAHDAAAVKLIVEEAGGKVTDLYGNEQRYDQDIKGAIVSNGHLHDQLVTLTKPHLLK